MSPSEPRPHLRSTDARILVADDDPMVRSVLKRLLERADFLVDTAASGDEATRRFQATAYDAIVSDVDMPDVTGIDLLRAVREHDLDLPVILVTGAPDIHSAMQAVEYGALRYMPKPVDNAQLVEVVSYAVNIHRFARLKRRVLETLGHDAGGAADIAGLEARFERALDTLWMAFQPIVSWKGKQVFAYEALMRCDEDSFPHPGAILEAAERLGRVQDLGRTIRQRVAEAIPLIPGDAQVFVNLHPLDLADDQLGTDDEGLTAYADRVVLEVTERATLDGVTLLDERLGRLRARGFRIAVDDLGAGYAGLNSFVRLRPEIVKLDMALIRNIDTDAKLRSIVGSILDMCTSLEVRAVVEGVETPGETQALARLGADLMQGYAFARPQREFVEVTLDVLSSLAG